MRKKLSVLILAFVPIIFICQQITESKIDKILSSNEPYFSNNYHESLEQNIKAYNLSKKINYEEGKLHSELHISICYIKLNNSVQALKYALYAKSDAEKLKNYSAISYSQSIIALKYVEAGFLNRSLEIIKEGFKMSKKIKDNTERHNVIGRLYAVKAIALANLKRPTREILKYNLLSKKEFDQVPNGKFDNYSNLVSTYIDLKKYDSAAYYIKKSLSKEQARNFKGILYGNLAFIELQKKNYENAINYAERSNNILRPLRDFTVIGNYEILMEAYQKTNNLEKLNESRALYTKYQDSTAFKKNNLIQFSLKQYVTEIEEEKNIKENKRIFYFIGIFIVLMLILLFLFLNYKKAKKHHDSSNIKLEQEQGRVRELELKINDAFKEVLDLAKKDDPAFLYRFREVYPEFYNKLINDFPDMTSGQIKFCALLRLNFSTKEIALYNNITVASVEKRKNRIRKQLNIPSDADINLWMINF